jgi:hypothetical protein
VVYVLLQHGADAGRRVLTRWATTNTYEQLALHLACKNGHEQVWAVFIMPIMLRDIPVRKTQKYDLKAMYHVIEVQCYSIVLNGVRLPNTLFS